MSFGRGNISLMWDTFNWNGSIWMTALDNVIQSENSLHIYDAITNNDLISCQNDVVVSYWRNNDVFYYIMCPLGYFITWTNVGKDIWLQMVLKDANGRKSFIMVSWPGNNFRVTGPSRVRSTDHRWIPLTTDQWHIVAGDLLMWRHYSG